MNKSTVDFISKRKRNVNKKSWIWAQHIEKKWKKNGATAAWVLTFDLSLKQNKKKKEEFSTLKPDRNKTKCVLKTDKSVSSGKTHIHSKELQLSDFHHKLNVSSLADLLWQTHRRSMLKNKTQSYRNDRQPAQGQADRHYSVFSSLRWCLVFGLFGVPASLGKLTVWSNRGTHIIGYSYCWWKDLHGASRWRGISVHLCHRSHTHLFTSLAHRMCSILSQHVLHLSEKILSQTTNQLCLK